MRVREARRAARTAHLSHPRCHLGRGGGRWPTRWPGRARRSSRLFSRAGARVAAKKFFDSSLSSSAFEREAALLADLRHPNVVQLIKVWAPHLIRRQNAFDFAHEGDLCRHTRRRSSRCAASPCRASSPSSWRARSTRSSTTARAIHPYAHRSCAPRRLRRSASISSAGWRTSTRLSLRCSIGTSSLRIC